MCTVHQYYTDLMERAEKALFQHADAEEDLRIAEVDYLEATDYLLTTDLAIQNALSGSSRTDWRSALGKVAGLDRERQGLELLNDELDQKCDDARKVVKAKKSLLDEIYKGPSLRLDLQVFSERMDEHENTLRQQEADEVRHSELLVA